VHALTYPVLAPVHAAFRRWAGTIAEEDESDEDADDDVEAFIEVGEREGILEEERRADGRGIVDLDSTLVREIMTPASTSWPSGEFLGGGGPKRGARRGASRFPVYGETIDSVVGILHVRDLLRAGRKGSDAESVGLVHRRSSCRNPHGRRGARRAEDAAHSALVVDEYGGFAGWSRSRTCSRRSSAKSATSTRWKNATFTAEDGGVWIVRGRARRGARARVRRGPRRARLRHGRAASSPRRSGASRRSGETFEHAGCASRSSRPIPGA
jgi:hypothetical protein